MSVVFKYKNFIGSIEVSTQDKCLHGSVLYINDLVTYEAKTVDALEKEFKKAVDDYLKTCKKLGREPSRSFNGTLNVRIGSDLHKKTAEYAALYDISINEYIKNAVQNQVATNTGGKAEENKGQSEILSLFVFYNLFNFRFHWNDEIRKLPRSRKNKAKITLTQIMREIESIQRYID